MTFAERYGPQDSITPDELESGLKWLVHNGVGAQVMETLAAGAFLTAFALSLGASNFYIGLIAAVPHFANIVQIGGVYLIERYRKRRVLSLIGGALSRIMLLIILAAAFIPDPKTAMAVLLVGLAARYGFGAMFACCWNAWIRDLVPDERRGAYMGKRLFYMSMFAIPIGLAVAFMIDLWGKFALGPIQYAYAVLFLLAFLAGSYGVYTLTKVPEPRMPDDGNGFSLKVLLTRPFAENNYRRLMVFLAAWHFAINLATPFFAVHMLKRLGLELSLVIVFVTLSQIANILVLRQWGAIVDRFANKTVLGVCGPLYIICIFLWTFTTFPEKHAFTIPLLVGLHIVMGVATAGVNIASTNIAFKLAPAGEATAFLATNSLVSAAAAGIAPIIGGAFADILADYKLSLILEWESPARVFVLQTLKFEHWDFFFVFAALIGLYSMHRLGLVREEGEVAERVVLTEILQDARRTFRSWSNVPGLRSATEFPFELLRFRRRGRPPDEKNGDDRT
ncbi:MAG: MFS transporter [Rhodospirillales bacterium]